MDVSDSWEWLTVSLLHFIDRRVTDAGDRLLERVVPRSTASASWCALIRPCCARVSQGRIERGYIEVNGETGRDCSGCITFGQPC
ncbi:hypothetical protein WEH80_25995 [Actinomycetes bacterium KLBMP 9759]